MAWSGTVQGLAGPVARGDAGTVERHLRALAALDKSTLGFYREMAAWMVPIAVEKGTLCPEQAARLEAALSPRR